MGLLGPGQHRWQMVRGGSGAREQRGGSGAGTRDCWSQRKIPVPAQQQWGGRERGQREEWGCGSRHAGREDRCGGHDGSRHTALVPSWWAIAARGGSSSSRGGPHCESFVVYGVSPVLTALWAGGRQVSSVVRAQSTKG